MGQQRLVGQTPSGPPVAATVGPSVHVPLAHRWPTRVMLSGLCHVISVYMLPVLYRPAVSYLRVCSDGAVQYVLTIVLVVLSWGNTLYIPEWFTGKPWHKLNMIYNICVSCNI